MTVLLTSAGVGSRLNPLTTYFNKSMLPVGKLPVISHIINNYPKNTDFIIALGHGGDHIKDYIQHFHPKLKKKFIKIENYSGKGSGLHTTLNICSEYIKSDFIFHVNDAIIKEKFITDFSKDTLLISKKYFDLGEFRTVSIKDKKINKINEKFFFSKKEDIYSYIGVAYVKDYKLFNNIISDKKNNLAELNYFKYQLERNNLNFHKINKWFDTGTIQTLNETMNELSDFLNLNKLDEAIYFKSKKVIKFYTNKELIKKRVKRAEMLKKCVPKVDFSSNFFFSYKFINGKIFSQSNPSVKEFKKLMIFLEKNLWKSPNTINNAIFKRYCKNFYYQKT